MEVDGAGENARANGGGGGDDNVVTSIERALLQYLLAARVVEDSLLRNFYNSVLRAFPVKPAEWPLELSVSALNQALLPLSLEVRTARLELDGLTWWGVVSTKGDDAVAALASNLSPEEVRPSQPSQPFEPSPPAPSSLPPPPKRAPLLTPENARPPKRSPSSRPFSTRR